MKISEHVKQFQGRLSHGISQNKCEYLLKKEINQEEKLSPEKKEIKFRIIMNKIKNENILA